MSDDGVPVTELRSSARVALGGALSAVAGIILSGPVAMVTVAALHPQPPWEGARAFVAAYHPVQVLPYVFGFYFVGGCVALTAGLAGLSAPAARPWGRLGLVAAAMGAGLIFFNYVLQTTFVPALVRADRPALDDLTASLTMVNPASLAWALEMWGYGLLGLGSWLAAGALDGGRLERAARIGLAGNGVISLVGTAITVVRLDWVLTTAGMVSYIAWNAYFLGVLGLTAVALRTRAGATAARPHAGL